MNITFEQMKKAVKILESDEIYEFVANKVGESLSRIYITNVELSDDFSSIIINLEISYCSCCRPESSSITINEDEFNELVKDRK